MRVVLGDVAGDTAEVVDAAVRLDRPLDHAPLQQIVRHQVAVLVGACAVEIPDLVAVMHGQRPGDRLALVKGHIQPRVLA